MFDRLIQHYASASIEVLARATLEDMAMLTALRDSLEQDEEAKARLDFVPDLVEAWLSVCANESQDSNSLRLQPLLGCIVQKLAATHDASQSNSLNRSELDLMKSAQQLIERAGPLAPFEHIRRILAIHSDAAARASAILPPQPGLPGFEGRIHIISSLDLLEARNRAVNTLTGLSLPARGPILTRMGDVRVLDHIPDNCTLVVESGSCTVNGYVLGRIACAGGCDVRDTVAGVIIANHGDIRVRAILNRAYVVAKLGSAQAERAEDPELLFAGEKILIDGEARMGTYIAPTIVVGGEVHSGNFSFCKSMSATRFKMSDTRDLILQLREKVTNEDYGEITAEGADRLLGEVARLRREIRNQRNLLAIAARECDRYASSAVIYLAGGEEKVDQIKDLNRAQRRLAFLDRVVTGIDLLSEAAEDQLRRGIRNGRLDILPKQQAITDRDFFTIHEELATEEEPVDDDLSKESEELKHILHRIRGLGMASPALLLQLREKKLNWLLERNTLVQSIREKHTTVRDASGRFEHLGLDNDNISKVQVLGGLLATSKKDTAPEILTLRMQKPFMQIMLRSIEARRDRMLRYKASLDDLGKEYEDSSNRLMEEHHIPASPLEISSPSPPEVTGCFDAGVTLCTESYMIDGPESSLRSVLITEDSGDTPVTYRRMSNVIVEENVDVPVS